MKRYFPFIILLFNFAACQSEKNTSAPASYETYRSQYHFTPASGWMNDPNGMVFYEGEYHLFYQHYPDSTVWGPMHWGHAVSKDMIHWEHLPIALYPDEHGMIFSGSAVVDWNNTSGLGTAQTPPLVAIYTYHLMEGEKAGRNDFQTQGIAYSTDKGRTWTKYENNPVLANPGIRDFRDPKVSWNEASKQWVMALAVQDHIEFFGSPDLKHWSKLSEFGKTIGAHGGVWECPDLFPLKDEQGTTKWVLFVSMNPGGPQGGSATQYFVGDFDGKNFTPQDTTTRWIDYGADNYAGVTWSDVPASDGRRLFIGWMSNWQYANLVPTQAWRSATTLPREVTMIKTTEGYELKFKPVGELEKIQWDKKKVAGSVALESPLSLVSFDLKEDEKAFFVTLYNGADEHVKISFQQGFLTVDRTMAGVSGFSEVFAAEHKMDLGKIYVNQVKVYVDLASIEIFINDGERVMTEVVFPTTPYTYVKVEKKTPEFHVTSLSSIWK